MNKFTIFTVILSVSVITVIADLAYRDYLSKQGEANVLNEEMSPVLSDLEQTEPENTNGTSSDSQIDGTSTQTDVQPTSTSNEVLSVNNVELPPLTSPPPTAINQDLINQAGFNAVLSEQRFNGRVFQLLDITKTPVDGIYFYEIVADSMPVASVTEISLRDEIKALQLYVLLQNKTKPYIDLSLNETNAYGDRSFYINHAKKPEEAFLTVKIGKKIYAFAYVKYYHPEIKKLIQLLTP